MAGKVELKKSLNVVGGISFLISMIIGSGIFIVPNGIIRDAGSVGLAGFVWLFGGTAYALFGALSYAELGCLIPKTGGEYAYLMTAFSDITGFLFVWVFTFIFNPAVAAFAALLFSDYALKVIFPTCEAPQEARLLLAAVAIIIITLINCYDVKIGQNLGILFNIGKITGLLMIICFGAYGLFLGRVESFKNPFENSTTDVKSLVIAINAGCFSYNGWNSLNNLVGEMKTPNKTFPTAIFGGLALTIFIYFTANIAYLTFLSPAEMIASNAVAFTFVEKLIGSWSWIISLFVCLSGLGFINSVVVGMSRIIFAAANNNHFPSVFGVINIKYKSPIIAVIFAGFLPCVYINLGSMDILLNISMLVTYVVNITAVIALLYMRKTRPDDIRPFKVPLIFPIGFIITCSFLTISTAFIFPFETVLCALFIILAVPVYYIGRAKKPESMQAKIDNFTTWVQKLTLSVSGEKSD